MKKVLTLDRSRSWSGLSTPIRVPRLGTRPSNCSRQGDGTVPTVGCDEKVSGSWRAVTMSS